MRRLRLALLLIALLMLSIALVVSLVPSREPGYAGHTLSEWVDTYSDFSKTLPGESDDAIRHIGTNAIPDLLKWVRYEMPAWKSKLYAVFNPILGRLKQSWKLTANRETTRANDAMRALLALGPSAERAAPDLARMLNNPKASTSATRAAAVLAKLGNVGLPPLLARLKNQPANPGLRMALVYHVGCFGTNALGAFPIVRRFVIDPDLMVRITATNALWMINREGMERASR